MLIGLVGKPQSGKSEVRRILANKGFFVVNTKTDLIEACSALTGIDRFVFHTQSGKDTLYHGVQLRKIMGKVQDTMEGMFGDYHSVDRAIRNLGIDSFGDVNAVVDSLRKSQPLKFPGTIVEVVSKNSFDSGNSFDEYDKSRISWVLHNNGTLEDLEAEIDTLLEAKGARI